MPEARGPRNAFAGNWPSGMSSAIARAAGPRPALRCCSARTAVGRGADSSSSPAHLARTWRAPAATRWRPSQNSSSHCLPARPPGSHPQEEQGEGNAPEGSRPCDASRRGAAAARPAGRSPARPLAAVAGPEATDPGAGSVARPARSASAEHLSGRRDAIAHVKELAKKHEVSEDDDKRAETEIQKLTDKSIADIDRLVADKEKDLMAV